MDRFFYHSFPRAKAADRRQVGLRIVDSICRNGLLLVPERVSWSDPTQQDPSNRTWAVQRRISFTELAPDELERHAELFGPFAIEFPIDVLRSLGALPVIYIPDHVDAQTLHGATGASILSNVAAISAVLASIARTISLTGPTLEIDLKMKNGERTVHEFSEIESHAIKTYLGYLLKAQGIPFDEMSGALTAMASLFYPTDNLKYTGPLGYYRQREWRLISGSFVNGAPTTSVTTDTQRDELLNLNAEFFSKELLFADGTYSLAAKSHYMRDVNGRHVLSRASRLIAPSDSVAEVKQIIAQHDLDVPVCALESLRIS